MMFSKVERFKAERIAAGADLGPGYYDVNDKAISSQAYSKGLIKSTQPKFKENLSTNVLGPGAYDTDILSIPITPNPPKAKKAVRRKTLNVSSLPKSSLVAGAPESLLETETERLRRQLRSALANLRLSADETEAYKKLLKEAKAEELSAKTLFVQSKAQLLNSKVDFANQLRDMVFCKHELENKLVCLKADFDILRADHEALVVAKNRDEVPENSDELVELSCINESITFCLKETVKTAEDLEAKSKLQQMIHLCEMSALNHELQAKTLKLEQTDTEKQAIEKEKTNLQLQIDDLRGQLSIMGTQYEEFKMQQEQLINSLENTIKSSKEKLSENDREIYSLKTALKDAEAQMEKYKEECAKLENSVHDLSAALTKANSEIHSERSTLMKEREKTKSLQEELFGFQVQINTSKARNEELQMAYDSLKEQNRELKTQKEFVISDLHSKEEKLYEVQSLLTASQEGNAMNQEEIARLNHLARDSRATLDKANESLIQERGRFEHLENEKKLLDEQCHAYCVENNSLRERCLMQETKIEEAMKKIASAEEEKCSYRNSNLEAEMHIRKLNEKFEALNRENAQLLKDMEDERAKNEHRLTLWKQEDESKHEELKIRQEELASMRAKLEELSAETYAQSRCLISKEKETKDLNMQISKLQEELQSNSSRMASDKKMMEELSQKENELHRKCIELEKGFAEQASKFKSDYQSLKSTLLTEEKKYVVFKSTKENEIESLHQTIREDSKLLESLKESNAQLEEGNKNLNDMLKKKIEQSRNLQNALTTLSSQFNKFSAKEDIKCQNCEKTMEDESKEMIAKALEACVSEEARKISEESAKFAGHNNHKQKIQYLKKVKMENLELKQQVTTLLTKQKILEKKYKSLLDKP